MKTSYLFFVLFIFFTGCANKSIKIGEILQSNNATQVAQDHQHIIKLLLRYQKKLNLRNPNSYNKKNIYLIKYELQNNTNTIFLKYHNQYIKNHNDYLKASLNTQDNIQYRDDLLILGIYKYIWYSYKLDNKHKITTFGYDADKLKSLYYAISVLKWKISTKKDLHGNYLFLTWQNNWQIELNKKLKNGINPSWKLIQNLKYIKTKKETIFSHSNFNFEILMNQMLYHIKHSLKLLGNEPLDISIEAMKNLIFFL